MIAAEEFADTADWYRRFAELETPGQSAMFENWALGVAEDSQVLGLIAQLPKPKVRAKPLSAH